MRHLKHPSSAGRGCPHRLFPGAQTATKQDERSAIALTHFTFPFQLSNLHESQDAPQEHTFVETNLTATSNGKTVSMVTVSSCKTTAATYSMAL